MKLQIMYLRQELNTIKKVSKHFDKDGNTKNRNINT